MDRAQDRWMGEWVDRGSTGVEQRANWLRVRESCLCPDSHPYALWALW